MAVRLSKSWGSGDYFYLNIFFFFFFFFSFASVGSDVRETSKLASLTSFRADQPEWPSRRHVPGQPIPWFSLPS